MPKSPQTDEANGAMKAVPPRRERFALLLDRNLAIIGALLSILMAVGLSLFGKSIVNFTLACALFLTCFIYLRIRSTLSPRRINTQTSEKLSTNQCLIANIVFFALLSTAILLIVLRSDPYARPQMFFIILGLLCALLALESAFLPPIRGYEYWIILKIILVGILIRETPQFIFPGHVWFDPWYHEKFIKDILANARIPEVGTLSYERLPIMHLFFSAIMLITGMDFKGSFMMLVSPLQVVLQAVFMYLLALKITSGRKIALQAVLLITVADDVAAQGMIAYPNMLAVILLLMILYITSQAREKQSGRFILVNLILMTTLLMTHTLTSIAAALLLACFWIGFEVYKRISAAVTAHPFTSFYLVALFVISMLSWWMYASGHYLILVKAVRWALQPEYFRPPAPEEAIAYSASLSNLEILLDRAGFIAFCAISVFGCLYLISRQSNTGVLGFVMSLISAVFIVLAFSGSVFNLYILPTRWIFISQVLLIIPAAIGIAILASRVVQYRGAWIAAVIGLLAFFMNAGSLANFDTPIFSSAIPIRHAFFTSEIQSMNTVTGIWDGPIASDQQALAYLQYARGAEVEDINPALDAKDFSSLEGSLILIRLDIVGHPFFAGGYTWKLDYDPRDLLALQRHVRVYDSGSITVFL